MCDLPASPAPKEDYPALARRVAESHRQLFGDSAHITEINAGFNNRLFCVNDRFIIKICGNPGKEALFDTESRFYLDYRDSGFLPRLFCYDPTKAVIPHPYEILEKIKGQTVYHLWPSWDEAEREALIRELMAVIRRLHAAEYPRGGWAERLLSEITLRYENTKSFFTEEEQAVIEASFPLYADILKECRYARIHNDLHFDNIFLDETGRIRLIDFNDSVIAPFDFDFRQLFMCRETPWRWADEETDPYQHPEDYRHIGTYIKKYNPELAALPYTEERMTVYAVWNELDLLSRFGNRECAENALRYAASLVKRMRKLRP